MDHRIDLLHLRAFVAVAEARNFARGARLLATSQSAISVRIRRLEDILGARVLDRDRQGTRLTPIGEQLLEDARRLLADSDRMVERIQAAASGQGEKIRIASTQRAMSAVTPKLISFLRREFPKAEFFLQAHSSPEQIEALRRGDIDMGILQPPAGGFGKIEGIASLALESEPLVVAMSADNPLARRKTLKWKDLKGRSITLAPAQKSETAFMTALLERCEDNGFEPVLDDQMIGFRAIMPYLASKNSLALIPASAVCTGDIFTRPVIDPLMIEFEMIWSDDIRKPLIPQISSTISHSGEISNRI